jgi:anti-anti-sigma regulatory factor
VPASTSMQWHRTARATHVASPSGELNARTMPELRRWVGNRLTEGADRIVIDLSHVTGIDEAAQAGLVICARAARAAHSRLVIDHGS